MGQQPDLRKGDQALVCACILRVSSGLWPLLRCPHPRFATPTLSLSPPLGHQCQMAATLYIRHQDSGRVSASLELRQSPGSLFPALPSRVVPGSSWCSQHFPAVSLIEMLNTDIPGICQPKQIPLMVPSQQVGSVWLPTVPPTRTDYCDVSPAGFFSLSSHSPSFKPQDLASSGWH